MDIDSPHPTSPPLTQAAAAVERSASPQQRPDTEMPETVGPKTSPPPLPQPQPQSQSQSQSQDSAPAPQSQSTYVSSSQPSTFDDSQPKPQSRSPSTAPANSEPSPAHPANDPDAIVTDDEPVAPLTNGHTSSYAPMANGNTHLRDEPPEHDTSSSSGVSAAPSVCVATDVPTEEDDMDRFLKRMDMEKKIAQLQQRLELASFKTNHGWSDMSINEIETRLPSAPQSRPQVVISGGRGVAYEPPSPNRPWQLADSLWQNLPQPGRNGGRSHPPVPSAHNFHRPPPHSMHAPSHSLPGGLPSVASLQMHSGPRGPPPASPRRHRMDEYLSRPTQTPSRKHANGHNNGRSGGHRRASSSISGMQFLGNDPYPASPVRAKKTTKKRSQSHSNLRERPTTQDVDAARALTSMLESGRSPTSATHERLPSLMEPPPNASGPRLPPLQQTSSFPPPFPSSEMPPPRPRAQSFVSDARDSSKESSRPTLPPIAPPGLRTPSSHARGRGQSMDSSAAFRGGFWQASNPKPAARDREQREQREREQRERDRQRERERDRSDRYEDVGRGEDDQKAAELMMFLAHSPSPVRKRAASDFPPPSFGGTARVLFADSDRDRDRDQRERERERMREPAPGPRPGPPSLPAPPRLQDQPMRG